jgi:hypothetical protein
MEDQSIAGVFLALILCMGFCSLFLAGMAVYSGHMSLAARILITQIIAGVCLLGCLFYCPPADKKEEKEIISI